MITFYKRLALFMSIIIAANFMINYYYDKPNKLAIVNKTHNKYLKWNEIQSSKKFNVIFLGSSRGYCAYNPILFDSITNLHSFNMCTGSQDIIQTYYILKEILLFQKPDIIVFDLCLPQFENTSDYYQAFSNSSFMSKINTADMIINGYGIEGIINYLLPAMKYRLYLKNDLLDLIQSKGKNTDSTNNNKWIQGYFPDSTSVDKKNIEKFPPLNTFYNTQVSNKKLNYYFDEFIKLCKTNKIKLICVTAPFPPSRIKKELPDTVSNYFSNICKSYDVKYYDLNYLKKDNYAYENMDFVDHLHMNYKGANKASKQLAELIIQNKK